MHCAVGFTLLIICFCCFNKRMGKYFTKIKKIGEIFYQKNKKEWENIVKRIRWCFGRF